MTMTFLLAAIIAAIAGILLVPITGKMQDGGFNLKFKLLFFIVVFVLACIVTGVILYITMIDLNWTAVWPAIAILALLGAFLTGGVERKIKGIIAFAGIAIAVYMLSAPVFNADKKYDSAKMTVATELKAFDETKTPASVPPKYARNKMNKAFGQVPNTSYFELGNLQIQKINDEFVYVAPVEFSDVFKWFKGDTTPGYFVVSATDSSANPKFVKKDMKYIPSAFLNDNVVRYMRLHNPLKIFNGEVQLEIDDDGTPYYIRTYGKFISARNGFEPQGIVMVNAQNGKIKSYKIKDVPTFIDGAISPEAVSLQNSYYGNYIHGYWNTIFGKKDIKIPSDEGVEANVSPVFDEEGTMYYFTDFTSPKEGVESMLGYSLTNAHTGEATYYTGSAEESYMDSAGALQVVEKKFVEKKWSGSMPLLYNFYGETSWLVPVLDSNGFLQNYYIVSAANPEIAVSGTSPKEALRLYKNVLSRSGSTTVNGSSSKEEKTTQGTVMRVYKETAGDFTNVSFLLSDETNYTVSSEVSPLAVYLQEGDTVKFTYLNTTETFLQVKDLTITSLNKKEIIKKDKK
ncbi:hypothetical protein [Kurthia sibirica]|uniref:Uncharacterized protein n=1 Tax=Kurthia sibirica TaxID=202750 RepID=A0A2U3APZ3_9BACL|nr:hypothetical protein [Kurthia sibirica]PWI26613.1 hypothetical protein DEX24_02290 [Kurthia sibirica]GEK32870.1 hypothetical protein KSI01_04030 [Kurthia sibirica]